MNFKEAKRRLEAMGWELDRVKGSHYIYRLNNDDKNEFILSQHRGDCKKYVVRKLRELEEQFKLNKPKKETAEEINMEDLVYDKSVESIISIHW